MLMEAIKGYAVHTVPKINNHNQSNFSKWKTSGVNPPTKNIQAVKNNNPPKSSKKLIAFESYFPANFPLIIENEADKKAENKATKIPEIYSVSTLKIIPNPKTTKIPNNTSYHTIFRLKKIGSKIEVKNAPVEIQAKVIDMLEILIAWKKVNQCKAITNPETINANINLGVNFKDIFLNFM